MKKITTIMMGLLALVLTGCSGDDGGVADGTATGEPRELLISATGIADVTGQESSLTRAVNNAWAANDKIGVFVMDDGQTVWSAENRYQDPWGTYFYNRSFTVQGAGTGAKTFLNTEAYVGYSGTSNNTARLYLTSANVDAYAYYPYAAVSYADDAAASSGLAAGSIAIGAEAGAKPTTLYLDVSTQTNQEAIDLLTASHTGALNNGEGHQTAAFTFEHRLSKLVFNLKAALDGGSSSPSTGLTPAQVANATLTIDGLRCRATYDVLTGTYVVLHNDNTAAERFRRVTAQPTTTLSGYDRSLELIALPNQAVNYPAGRHHVEISVANNTYDFYINTGVGEPAPVVASFAAGQRYTFNITLTNTGIQLMSYYITPWSLQITEMRQQDDYTNMPLTIEATVSGAVSMPTRAGTGIASGKKLQYRKYTVADGAWSDWAAFTPNTTSVTVAAGDKVQLRGNNIAFCSGDANYASLSTPANSKAYGNVMSVLYGLDNMDQPADFTAQSAVTVSNALRNLFRSDTGLTDAGNLVLPAQTLAPYCYYYMFNACTALTAAPMLPAMTLAQECYRGMFAGCTSLTTAPALPATTLAEGCYRGMFNACSALTTASALPALTLAPYCYYYMFSACTSLNEVHCYATDISATNSTTGWLASVSATGHFYGKSGAGWTSGTDGIPAGWTEHLE